MNLGRYNGETYRTLQSRKEPYCGVIQGKPFAKHYNFKISIIHNRKRPKFRFGSVRGSAVYWQVRFGKILPNFFVVKSLKYHQKFFLVSQGLSIESQIVIFIVNNIIFLMSKFGMSFSLTTFKLDCCEHQFGNFDMTKLFGPNLHGWPWFGSVRFGKQKVEVRFGSGETKISGSVAS